MKFTTVCLPATVALTLVVTLPQLSSAYPNPGFFDKIFGGVSHAVQTATHTVTNTVAHALNLGDVTKIVSGVGLGMLGGALTGDPTQMIMGGAMGGMQAGGVIQAPKGKGGQPQLTPQQQQQVNAFNEQWKNLGDKFRILILAMKKDTEVKQMEVLMTKENKKLTKKDLDMFHKMKPDQQQKYVQDAANEFKAKQSQLQLQQQQAQQQAQGVQPAAQATSQEAVQLNALWPTLSENAKLAFLLSKPNDQQTAVFHLLSDDNQHSTMPLLQRFQTLPQDQQQALMAQGLQDIQNAKQGH